MNSVLCDGSKMIGTESPFTIHPAIILFSVSAGYNLNRPFARHRANTHMDRQTFTFTLGVSSSSNLRHFDQLKLI